MKKLIFVLIMSLFYVELLSAQEVSPFDQCRNYASIMVKEKDRAQLDLATYMSRVEILEKEKSALEEKIKVFEKKEDKKE